MRQHRGQELGPDLLAAAPDPHRDQAGRLLQHQVAVEIAHRAGRGQMDRAADRRMAGKGDLGCREEDAHPCGMGRIGRGLDEDRLGQVELAREGLHLRRAQPVGLKDDGQRIARKGPVGEDIAGVEGQHGAALSLAAG